MPKFQTHRYYYPATGLEGRVHVALPNHESTKSKLEILCGASSEGLHERRTLGDNVVVCVNCAIKFKAILVRGSSIVDSW